jgi:hypothetical protein
MLGSSMMICVAATLVLAACGGDPNVVNPLPVADAGPDAAADAAHDASADADAAPKIADASAD